jgi:hypothetical protein
MSNRLPQVVEKSIHNAQALLRAAGCSFRIVDSIGEEHLHDPDNRFAPKRAARKRTSNVPHGALTQHFRPYITDVKVGDVVEIPIEGFSPESLRSSLCARLSTEWGKGSYACTVNKKTKAIEVLRIQ